MKPQPFRVDVPAADLEALTSRLRQTRWAHDFGNADWKYGVERSWLEEMVRYWCEEFDWRAQEQTINEFEQYRVEIDSVPVHFVHMHGKGTNPLPLVLTHGWPWTFWDYAEVIGPLVDPVAHGGDAADAFDVVVPSLPGFGFSVPLRTTGVDVRWVARIWSQLMREVLGYDRFAAAGGDWGAMVTSELGHAHADHLYGCFITSLGFPGIFEGGKNFADYSYAEDERWMVERLAEVAATRTSHRAVLSNDPQTLAYALVDSPVGTAAWLWERRREWSDCGGDVLSVFSRDFLCTTSSIYWLNQSIGTASRLYYEQFRRDYLPLHDREPVVEAPTGVVIGPKELGLVPRAVAERKLNLHSWEVLPRGGHFSAAEQPEVFVDRVRRFFRPLRPKRGPAASHSE